MQNCCVGNIKNQSAIITLYPKGGNIFLREINLLTRKMEVFQLQVSELVKGYLLVGIYFCSCQIAWYLTITLKSFLILIDLIPTNATLPFKLVTGTLQHHSFLLIMPTCPEYFTLNSIYVVSLYPNFFTMQIWYLNYPKVVFTGVALKEFSNYKVMSTMRACGSNTLTKFTNISLQGKLVFLQQLLFPLEKEYVKHRGFLLFDRKFHC